MNSKADHLDFDTLFYRKPVEEYDSSSDVCSGMMCYFVFLFGVICTSAVVAYIIVRSVA